MMEAELKQKLPALSLLSFSTFVVCSMAAFTQIISFDLMMDLNAFPSKMYAWAFPTFVAGEVAAMGFCACLIDRYGRRTPYLIGSLMFIISTAICAISTEMDIFLVFRLFQGFGAGLVIITCIAQILYDITDPKVRYVAHGIMSFGFGAGMLFGLFGGKAFTESLGWPVAFWIFAILQAIVTYPSWEALKNGKVSEMKADIPGAIVIMIWSGCIVLFFQKMYLDWTLEDPECMMVVVFLVMLFLIFLLVETANPNSVFHRKVDNEKLVIASLIFIILLGIIDMAAVGYMVKISLFTYQMSVGESAPFFIVMICGAAVTALSISHFIDRTGHLPWMLLSAILSPIALISIMLVKESDPTYMLAVHLFVLGLAMGCLVSMLNATIQNRCDEHNNGAYISFAIMMRTVSLWLGYNFYLLIADNYMKEHIGGIMEHWNEIMPFELPIDSNLASMLLTPLGDVVRLIPGLTDDIADIFAQGVGMGFMYGSIIFVIISVPTALLLVGREKTL